MLRALPTILGLLSTVALTLTACGHDAPHGGAASAQTAAPMVTVPRAKVGPHPSAAPDSAMQGPLASVPEGACNRKPTAVGEQAKPAVEPDQGDVLMPMIKDRLADKARGAVDACFAQARAKTPGLSGRLVTSFMLPPEGGVTHAAVEAGIGDETLHTCVAKALQSAALPSFVSGSALSMSNQLIVLCPDGTSSWPTSHGWR